MHCVSGQFGSGGCVWSCASLHTTVMHILEARAVSVTMACMASAQQQHIARLAHHFAVQFSLG